jgi:hypothetical protein
MGAEIPKRREGDKSSCQTQITEGDSIVTECGVDTSDSANGVPSRLSALEDNQRALNTPGARGENPLLLGDFYFGKFFLYRGDDIGVLGLTRTSSQSVSRVSGVGDGIFSGVFFHEVRLREFFLGSIS